MRNFSTSMTSDSQLGLLVCQMSDFERFYCSLKRECQVGDLSSVVGPISLWHPTGTHVAISNGFHLNIL